jgi:hypothetical protein
MRSLGLVGWQRSERGVLVEFGVQIAHPYESVIDAAQLARERGIDPEEAKQQIV